MKEHLFVYGTLGPDRPNEHVMTEIGGTWSRASVVGRLREAGWGAEFGYPGIDLVEGGDEIEGYLFTSENLQDHWSSLDEFEGDGYRRVPVNARQADGSTLDAWIYVLNN